MGISGFVASKYVVWTQQNKTQIICDINLRWVKECYFVKWLLINFVLYVFFSSSIMIYAYTNIIIYIFCFCCKIIIFVFIKF